MVEDEYANSLNNSFVRKHDIDRFRSRGVANSHSYTNNFSEKLNHLRSSDS